MKAQIHPAYYPEARITCACGNVIVVGATVAEMTTEVCSSCHPFFTGEQRIVDTAGQVERFMRRLEAGETQRTLERTRAVERREQQLAAKRQRRGLTPLRRGGSPGAATAPAESAAADTEEATSLDATPAAAGTDGADAASAAPKAKSPRTARVAKARGGSATRGRTTKAAAPGGQSSKDAPAASDTGAAASPTATTRPKSRKTAGSEEGAKSASGADASKTRRSKPKPASADHDDAAS